MASASTLLSMGFGSWGGVNLLPTLGAGIGSEPAIARTWHAAADAADGRGTTFSAARRAVTWRADALERGTMIDGARR